MNSDIKLNDRRQPFKNWRYVTKDTANLWLTLSEKRLQETIDTISNNKHRAYQLIGIILSVTMAASGYAFSNPDSGLFVPIAAFAAMECVSLMLIGKALFSVSAFAQGSAPSSFVGDELIIPEHDDQTQFVVNVLNYLDSIEERIEGNNIIAKQIAWYVNRGLLLSLFVAPITYLILSYLYLGR